MRIHGLPTVFLALACGSSSDTGLFGATGAAGGGGSPSGGSGAVAASGGSGGSSMPSGGSAGLQPDASAGQAGSGASAGAGGSGGASAEGGSGGMLATGGTGGVPGVGTASCGVAACPLGANDCCLYLASRIPAFSCQPQGLPCVGTVIRCDGHEDCPGTEVCCGQLSGGGTSTTYSELRCRPQVECTTSANRRWICGQTGICPSNLSCKQSQLLPSGYTACSL